MDRVSLAASDLEKFHFNPLEARGPHGEWEHGGGLKPLPESGRVWGLPSVGTRGPLHTPREISEEGRHYQAGRPAARGQLVYVTRDGKRERGTFERVTPEGKWRIALRSGDFELDPGEVTIWHPGMKEKMTAGELAELLILPELVKVGPEGYIHGFICVRPPCGEKPGKIKAADLAVQRDGGIVHRKSGYAVGHVARDDSGAWIAHHADGTKTSHRGARTEALKAVARRYNSGKTQAGAGEMLKPEAETPAARKPEKPATAKPAPVRKLSPADEVRVVGRWATGYRFGGRTDLKTKQNVSFMSELRRMMTGDESAGPCDAGCQDAHDFLHLVDQKAEKQPDTIYRGMSLTPDQVAQLFPKGKTVDLPVASFSKSVSVAKKYAGAFGKHKSVIIRVNPGAKGLDLVPIQSRSASADIRSIRDEAEVVSGGRFRVESIASPPFSNVINITLTQVDASAH